MKDITISRRSLLVSAGLLALAPLAGCGGNSGSGSAAAGSDYTIGVLQLTEHSALDAANDGFVKAIKESGLKVKIDQKNAQNDQSTCKSIADKFVGDNVNLIYAIATPAAQAAADAPTGLKKLLGAVSADITVELDGAQLFYPEYSEFLDENTPAHIFNHSIEGEGYRMRECFTPGGAVDYAAFDASFAQACVGENEDKLCRLALGRLVQPFGLGDDARADYELYLTAHPEAAFRRAIDDRDEAALRLLVGLSLPTADAAVYCARVGWSAGAAVLLGRAKRAKKTYDFDDL